MIVLAHGLGGRTDLPIPRWLALYGAGIAVVISFAALTALWSEQRLTGGRAGRPVPPALQRFADSAVLRTVLRALVLALAVLVVVVAYTGPSLVYANLAPWAFYITFWVGLIPLSLLLGPVWKVVNPLRLLHSALSRLSGTDPDRGLRELPERVGYWPAAATLAIFVWLELVLPDRDSPRVVGAFMVAYAAVNILAAAVYGSRWFSRGDGFEVYSSALGRLSVLGRRDDGRIVIRNPLNGLAAVGVRPGLVAVVAVLVGSTAFDGLTRTRYWQDNVDARSVPLGTLGLFGMIAAVGVLYVLAARLSGRRTSADGSQLPGRFASTLIPIAAGYAVAHYFSLFLLDGQQTLILASDPFQSGSDLLGTARWAVNYALLSPDLIAWVQVGAIVLGHIIGVVAAHDRALGTFPAADAQRSQYPLLAVMVLFTVTGVGLLVSS